jgi:hypothetical protein
MAIIARKNSYVLYNKGQMPTATIAYKYYLFRKYSYHLKKGAYTKSTGIGPKKQYFDISTTDLYFTNLFHRWSI